VVRQPAANGAVHACAWPKQPLVLVDWLPWNHTFGGNHNFGMVVFHGGTLYIDDGKPTPALMHETLRNLREIAPTVYFNVPTGFEAIAQCHENRRCAAQEPCCRACKCSSTQALRWRNPFGTACMNPKNAKSASALSWAPAWA